MACCLEISLCVYSDTVYASALLSPPQGLRCRDHKIYASEEVPGYSTDFRRRDPRRFCVLAVQGYEYTGFWYDDEQGHSAGGTVS